MKDTFLPVPLRNSISGMSQENDGSMFKYKLKTRLHSSRMHTACLLAVSQYALHRGCVCVYLPGGGVYLPGGVPTREGVPARGVYLPWGVNLPGACICWGVYLPRGVPTRGV